MKEDILEQLVEDWYVARPGFFVKHNVRFRPSKAHVDFMSKRDSVHSDIDILALSTSGLGSERVHVVTCKSWQSGFDVNHWRLELEKEAEYNERSAEFKPRESWKYFRELVSDKWMDAFLNKIESETGQRDLTYLIAVTKIKGTESDRKALQQSEVLQERFREKGSTVIIKVLSLREIIAEYFKRIDSKDTPSLEATDVGRLLQLVHAAGLRIS
ncbi:hypothetical protein OJ996_24620 [Luteolibacter sp. GHJ8]|uniref:Restriction endonuclease n=1 Tax=Luteolibacter rhizosphaerae TaxID=2989719 RepID=A0ABT3GAE6_9BACT|nr:hypothetical protein [Luteolibacter rhizosphaerae]MCW1916795.1 hypothetical protein [Luteolibacter rhizosphaerae]